MPPATIPSAIVSPCQASVSGPSSIVGSSPTLIVAGHLGGDELLPIAALVPGALLGYRVSGWLAGHLDKRTARPLILGLSAAAAVAVLVRALA